MNRRGLTLMELLVAMILTGILAWLAMGMFSGESANYRRTREKVKMQSDARDAMRIMEEELRNAGFANRILGSSRISQAVSECTDVQYSGSGEAIQAVNNSSSIDSGDQISVRYFEIPVSGVLTSCATGASSQFREISYRMRNGALERRYRKDPADAGAAWIPFLQNVVSFQIQYGMLTKVSDHPTNLTPTLTQNSANWSALAGAALTVSGTATTVVLTGWNAAQTRTAYLTQAIDTTNAGEAYKVSFTATPNSGFVDGTNGYDTTFSTSGSGPGLRLSFLNVSSATEFSTVAFRVSPIADVAQNYEVFLTATGNTTAASNPVRIAISGRLRSGATSGTQSLTLTNFQVQRANRAKYFRWLSAPTSAELAQVGAVRVHLVVKTPEANGEGSATTFTPAQLGDTLLSPYTASGIAAKQSHVLFERIIPVVNNAI